MSLERAGERQGDAVPGAEDCDGEILSGLGIVPGQQSQLFARCAVREHPLSPRAAAAGEALTTRGSSALSTAVPSTGMTCSKRRALVA